MPRTNFLQTPNIAFELLTNEFDLVGYQKLLRHVGIGKTWKGGNNALQKLLGMSYGRVIKLKTKLKEVGFIEIIPGDNGHGEADGWKILDVFEYKTTLSPNEQGQEENAQPDSTLSRNEQGQEVINTGIPGNPSGEIPCHETNKSLSPDEQATLSRNEQHKEKIFIDEVIREEEREISASATFEPFAETANLANQEFRHRIDTVLHWVQMEKELSRGNFPASEWLTLIQNLIPEGINTPSKFKEFYLWVENLDWVETVSPELMKKQIEKFKKRDKLQAKKVQKQNGAQHGKSEFSNNKYPAKRTDKDVFAQSADFYNDPNNFTN